MSNELESAFAALAADAGRGRLLPAAETRRRADRRAVRRSVAAVAASAVLVTGAAATGWALAGDNRSAPPPPAQSLGPAPSSSSVPSSSPSEVPSSGPSAPSSAPPTTPSRTPPSSGPPLPKSIPARAMLARADGNTGQFSRLDEVRDRTKFCADADYPSAEKAAVRASVFLVYRRPEAPESNVPDDTVYNTVSVYRADGAEEFMDELRAAVRACPSSKVGASTWKIKSLGGLGLGDESVLVERSAVARDGEGEPETDGSRTYHYLAAVRVGDAVTMVETAGYENFSSEREWVDALTATAAERLEEWRG